MSDTTPAQHVHPRLIAACLYGYDTGHNVGHAAGSAAGFGRGYDAGYEAGYAQALEDHESDLAARFRIAYDDARAAAYAAVRAEVLTAAPDFYDDATPDPIRRAYNNGINAGIAAYEAEQAELSARIAQRAPASPLPPTRTPRQLPPVKPLPSYDQCLASWGLGDEHRHPHPTAVRAAA